ncbi:outer membrane protein assembly factor BamB family protein [Larkinella punicea]|uniref:Pyrroloquinoline quinone-dependent dehydrogenase n=1 Tax=Larkinella punicea TaxID=2315727 RepID=A0A368JKB7_9BACT|nr:PQQ-binding-like beta-propeller repeat protein [Larkinella punicea]RCR67496.1 pyrroloquinoline quinone-dependent dehydrogenase [Larkinella punicea]
MQKRLLALGGCLAFSAALAFQLADVTTDWPEYNGDGSRSHYSPLDQINRTNVKQLKVAWMYASGGADTLRNRTQMQCNPLIIDGVLYGVSANTQAFAVEAAMGKPIWKTALTDNGGTLSRGVTYWADGADQRIFFGAGSWLHALDARTGKLIDGFGDHGRIDLKTGIERPGADHYVVSNTPNTIYKNRIIVGARFSESETALLGDIRAFDTRTGQLVWTFHTIPMKGEAGYETWSPANPRQRIGAANPWMGMAIDRKRGILYAPTGSAAHDFYGGNRKGNNLYANCLLALDAATGKKLWHYQLVHHDIWDRDPPAPPNLLTITQKGSDGRPRKIDVVALVTKQGFTFVFDRITGKPIFPIKETPFPQEAVSGEQASPTQPIPQRPAPFARQSFTEKEINSFAASRDSLVDVLRKANTGPYVPLTGKMTVFFPGTDGGAQWGGAATDPEGILYVPSKEVPVYTSLIPRQQPSPNAGQQTVAGNAQYQLYCSACHGTDRKGNHDGSYPSLVQVSNRLSRDQVVQVLLKGRGMMPSFSHISPAERDAVVDFLFNKTAEKPVVSTQKAVIPYQHTGYNRWYDRNGYPVSSPPWGTLTAVDLNTGEHRWQVPLGEYPELTKKGVPITGTDNYGGPLVTAGGLVFIAASRDEKFRAFDKQTGQVVWEMKLPAAGYATPSTYVVNGKQYIVIACGGGKLNTRSGDRYVAFCLSD